MGKEFALKPQINEANSANNLYINRIQPLLPH